MVPKKIERYGVAEDGLQRHPMGRWVSYQDFVDKVQEWRALAMEQAEVIASLMAQLKEAQKRHAELAEITQAYINTLTKK